MAFFGSLPAQTHALVKETLMTWGVKEIYVGCSGNFTIERIAATLGIRAHGCDVGPWTCTLGAYFTGQPITIRPKPELLANLPWLGDYLNTPEQQVATMMQFMPLSICIDRGTFAIKHNEYYQRLAQALITRWPDMHARTMEKLAGAELQLLSFQAMDVMDWLATVPMDAAILCYPPFGGDHTGARNYIADDTKILAYFDWEKPHFTMMDNQGRQDLFAGLMARQHWAFGSNIPEPIAENFLHGQVKATSRKETIYMYADHAPTRSIQPAHTLEPVDMPRLAPGEDIGNRLWIGLLEHNQFDALRSQYMNIGIRPGAATQAYAVCVDDRLCGVFAFAAHSAHGDVGDIYLLSDFPVRPSDYPHLAKLVLHAVLSTEVRQLAQRLTGRRIRTIFTTAFTNNRVSMKYRGIFVEANRKEIDLSKEKWGADIDPSSNTYYARKYSINYRGYAGRWSLAEALQEWKKRYGKKHQLARAGAQPAGRDDHD